MSVLNNLMLCALLPSVVPADVRRDPSFGKNNQEMPTNDLQMNNKDRTNCFLTKWGCLGIILSFCTKNDITPQRCHRYTPGGTKSMRLFFASLALSNLLPLRHLRNKRTQTNGKLRSAGGHCQRSTPQRAGVLQALFKDANPFPLEARGGIRVALWVPPPPPPPRITSGGERTIISCSVFTPTPTNGTLPYANETGIT